MADNSPAQNLERFFSIANIAYIADILPKTMSSTFYKKFKPLLTMTNICYMF